jgi:hypothetical protein
LSIGKAKGVSFDSRGMPALAGFTTKCFGKWTGLKAVFQNQDTARNKNLMRSQEKFAVTAEVREKHMKTRENTMTRRFPASLWPLNFETGARLDALDAFVLATQFSAGCAGSAAKCPKYALAAAIVHQFLGGSDLENAGIKFLTGCGSILEFAGPDKNQKSLSKS